MGRTLNSDWFANNFIMVFFDKNIFKLRIFYPSHDQNILIENRNKLFTRPVRRECRTSMIPVAVVVEVVVTSQSCESSQTDGVREEHLCTCINPHLSSKAAKVLATCLLNGEKICSFFKKKTNKTNKHQKTITLFVMFGCDVGTYVLIFELFCSRF